MAVTILETIKSKANAGNTAYIVILSLLCDTYSDLPTQYSLTGYELAQGCKAHVIDTNTDYMLDSNGTWHISGGEIWQNVYTKTETDTLLAGKQDTLTTAQLDAVNSGITAAKVQQYDGTVTDEAEDRAALVELVDGGAKNLLKNELGSGTKSGLTYTTGTDGSIVITGGTVKGGNADFVIPFTPTKTGQYVLQGCPDGGSGTTYKGQIVLYPSMANVVEIYENTNATATLTGGTQYAYRFRVYNGKAISDSTIYPMVCTAADWAISQKFVPYCPSMQEMYQMILALQ